MRTLWFKQRFVEPILRGSKTQTIRKPSNRLPAVGEIVGFSVGPRTPFAHARIIEVRELRDRELDADYRELLREIYGDFDSLVRIDFRVITPPPAEASEAQTSAPPRRSRGRRTRNRR